MATKIQPPEPPKFQNEAQMREYTQRLYRWLYEVYRRLDQQGLLNWAVIDTSDASIADLGVKDHNLLTSRDAASVHPHSSLDAVLQADDTSSSGAGGKHVTDALVKKYEDHRQASTNVHGIGTGSDVVGTATNQTLTNKTVDGDENTVRDLALTSMKTVLANANKVIRRDASGVAVDGNALPNSSEIVTLDATQQIENKTVSDLQIDLDGPARTPAEGLVYWDADAKTLAVKLSGPETVLQMGQELHVRVLNKTGADILNGQLVYVNGQHDNRPTVALAKADAAATAKITGMATETIEDNTTGYITVFGLVRGLDTSSYTAGDKIYLSAATAGAFTKTAPSFPNFVAFIGRVITSSATEGIVGVNPGVDHTNGVMVTTLGATGAKIGAIGTNYSEFEADGTLVAYGAATTFDDSQSAVNFMRVGGTPLTLDVLAGGIYQYRFDLTDEIHSQIQLNHRYKVGTDIDLHIHLVNKAAVGSTAYNVGIEVEYMWGGLDGVFGTPATLPTVNCSFKDAAALTHKVFELASLTPATGQGTISSYLLMRIKRVAGTTESLEGNNIFLLGVDVHVEQDTLGSRQEYVK